MTGNDEVDTGGTTKRGSAAGGVAPAEALRRVMARTVASGVGRSVGAGVAMRATGLVAMAAVRTDPMGLELAAAPTVPAAATYVHTAQGRDACTQALHPSKGQTVDEGERDVVNASLQVADQAVGLVGCRARSVRHIADGGQQLLLHAGGRPSACTISCGHHL